MKYLLMIFEDNSLASVERLGYFDDFRVAAGYLDSIDCHPSLKRFHEVSASQFLTERSAYPFRVQAIVGKRMRHLGYFDTLRHADDFARHYASKYPFVQLIVTEYGMRASTLDPESTLF